MAITKKILSRLNKDERGSLVIPAFPFGLFGHDLHRFSNLISHRLAKLNNQAHRIKSKVQPIHLVIAGGVLVGAYSLSFFWPRNISLAYSTETCITNPTILPKTVSAKSNAAYNLKQKPTLSLLGFPIYSQKTCISPLTPPTENSTDSLKLATLGISIFSKNIKVFAGSLPSLKPEFNLEKPVSVKHPLTFSVDKSDELFDYKLSANNQSVNCLKQKTEIACGVHKLKLSQSKTYEFKLERIFSSNPAGEVFISKLKTVEPVQVVTSSVANGQLVFTKPTDLSVTFSKPINSYDGVRLEQVGDDGKRETIPTTVSSTEAVINIKLGQVLPRDKNFELIISSVESTEQGFLPEPFVLSFRTSGGPKVAGVNIGSYKVSTTGNIVLTFDAGLAPGQQLTNFVSLEVSGNKIATTISNGGRTLTINPHDVLPRCTPFTVKVASGLINEFGVGEGAAWQYSSRTICQTVFSIGTSVRGRSIVAYRFGSGPSKIIFVGGMHGNEKSSVYTLNGFINHLEANALSIPANRTIIVIPNHNPDGFAASSRTNANGVDLNRNFPASDWQSGVYMPGNVYSPNGGGSAPLSEPESLALYNYVRSQSPRLVLTYHAVARVVISNDAGDSIPLGQSYGSKSGYRYVTDGESDGEFDYPTTGEFEDWLHDGPGIAALLIELGTMSSNEFNTHRNAMWAMSTLP